MKWVPIAAFAAFLMSVTSVFADPTACPDRQAALALVKHWNPTQDIVTLDAPQDMRDLLIRFVKTSMKHPEADGDQIILYRSTSDRVHIYIVMFSHGCMKLGLMVTYQEMAAIIGQAG
jgi:hypothetical protein